MRVGFQLDGRQIERQRKQPEWKNTGGLQISQIDKKLMVISVQLIFVALDNMGE
jgi:hypothetical protein